ncbi:MAG: FMN-binding glutamate synthase family protein, partial [Gammaproteobacteria bacterium]
MAIKVYSWLAAVTLVAAVLTWIWVPAGWLFVLILPAWAVALFDSLQRQHSLRRNFPLIGRARWIAEYLRPFVRQYFIESDTSGAPISRM